MKRKYMIALDTLNSASLERFMLALSGIYEFNVWVARRAWAQRPATGWASRLDLLEAMQAQLLAASQEEQLVLIRAHPELAGKAVMKKDVTIDSMREQKGAGLTACTPDEYARLQQLNADYRARFDFPFILAVKGHDPASVIAAFETRLHNSEEQEIRNAIEQINRIAMFRLLAQVHEPMAVSIMAMVDRLAQYSETPGELTCSYLSPAHRQAAELIRDWMWAAGLDAHIDALYNVVGRLPAAKAEARTLITGSHYDTVINGGKYDGRVGVLLPIAVADQLSRNGETLNVNLEVVAFGDEEGVRFGSTYLGSRALAGQFDPALLDRLDRNGVSLAQALTDAGKDPAQIAKLARNSAQLAGYVEVHIEQGPQLLSAGQPIGVVSAINGCRRLLIRFTGEAGHAGTVPMRLRHDALAAAAEFTLYVEQRCAAEAGLVGTVGRIEVPNGAINVIPGRCELSLDVRAADDRVRDSAIDDMMSKLVDIAQRRGVLQSSEEILRSPAIACDVALRQQLAEAARRVCGQPVSQLGSGAGHDAVAMSAITPIGMLFIRCGNGGVSHQPAESMRADDAELAAQVLTDFLRQLH